MKIGVACSMQFTEAMMQFCAELEGLGHITFMSSFKDGYIGKTDEEKELQKLKDKYTYNAIREFLK